MVLVRIPATSANMGPGFDTLGLALDMYNYVEIMETKNGLTIEITGEGYKKLARDESNLAYKAAQVVFQKLNYIPNGLKIRLENNIPLARGLGSSASVIVGGMVAANSLCGSKLTVDELLSFSSHMEGHPDNVAPALLGGIVISVQEGKELICRKIKPPTELTTVVAIPEYELSTIKARDVLPNKIPMTDAVYNISRTGLLVWGLMEGDLSLLGQVMNDRLHQPYRMSLVPGMEFAANAARKNGALAFALSGAGPSVVAFCTMKYQERLCVVLEEAFKEAGIQCKTVKLSPKNSGAEIFEEKGGNSCEHNSPKIWRQLSS